MAAGTEDRLKAAWQVLQEKAVRRHVPLQSLQPGEIQQAAKGPVRRLVCRSGNPYGLPAKDRSGNLNVTEPPDLGALLTRINRTRRTD